MGRKHYSGKELIARRQMERQRQQAQENGLRRWTKNINQLKIIIDSEVGRIVKQENRKQYEVKQKEGEDK